MRSLLSGLVDYWPLHEASGDRGSAIGRFTLTDNNTVTQNPGIAVYAAQLTAANTERLSLADNAEFSGDVDYTFWCWVYLDSIGAERTILSKYTGTGNQREYILYYNHAATQFEWLVSGDGIASTVVNDTSLGTPSTGTWYFLRAWHDSVANVIGIQSNLNTAVTTAHSTGSFNGTASFIVGAYNTSTSPFNGRICEVGFTKRLLTTQEHWWLYNNGLGRTFPFDGRPSPFAMGRHPAMIGPRRQRLVGVAA